MAVLTAAPLLSNNWAPGEFCRPGDIALHAKLCWHAVDLACGVTPWLYLVCGIRLCAAHTRRLIPHAEPMLDLTCALGPHH